MPDHATLPLWAEQDAAQKIETLRRLVGDLYGYVLRDARDNLIRLLEAHTPADQKEADDVRLIRDMLRQYPNLLNKNCEVGHITASAIVLDANSGRVLLHFHKSLNRWLQFGGHPEYETDPAQVALREAIEESGLPDLRFFAADMRPADIDVHTIPPVGNRPEHLHLDFRYVLATSQPQSLRAGTGESDQFMWLEPEKLVELGVQVDPALARLIGKASQRYAASKSDGSGHHLTP